MYPFQILSCSGELGSCCSNPALAISLDTVRKIMSLIQLIAPIILILMAVVKFSQLVMNPEAKGGTKKIMNSFLAAAIIFFIPVFADAVLTMMPQTFSVSACWTQAKVSAETYRNNQWKYASTEDEEKRKTPIIVDPSKYEKGGEDKSSGSAEGIIEGAEKVHSTYEQNGWAYYSSLGELKWNDIEYSTNNPSKKTCCATFVGSALYVGGVFTESEINEYNYNSQYGIDQLCSAHNWSKITSYSDLKEGDIVVMSSSSGGSTPAHVQIYAGNGTWYNAGSTNAIQRDSPYSDNVSSRFLYAWRKP